MISTEIKHKYKYKLDKALIICGVINWKIMIKIQATSMTTGSKKWFIMSDEDYKKRYTHYPAWSFNDNTKTSNIHEPE